jgi:hypothetical protein
MVAAGRLGSSRTRGVVPGLNDDAVEEVSEWIR